LTVALPGDTLSASFALRAGTDLSNDLSDRKRTTFGAAYDLGMAKVGFQRSTAEAGSAVDQGKFHTTSVGVSVPMGAFTLAATIDRGDYTDSGAAKAKFNGYLVSAFYALSKRTSLYAFAGGVDQKSSDREEKIYAAGVKHSF
jgi:predicted porin